jgi:type II secretory pathway pseudopilin PulG
VHLNIKKVFSIFNTILRKEGDEMKIIKLIKGKTGNNNGFILPIVIVVMVVLSILFLSVFTTVSSNARHITIQENIQRAHYVARSGVEVAYAALMEADSDAAYDYHLDRFIENAKADNTFTIEDTIFFPDDTNPIGEAKITVSREVITTGDYVGTWVKIQSQGSHETGSSSQVSYFIHEDDFTRTRWSRYNKNEMRCIE